MKVLVVLTSHDQLPFVMPSFFKISSARRASGSTISIV